MARGIVNVNIGGGLRTLSLNNNFLMIMGLQLKCDPIAVDEVLNELKTPMQMMATIIYCGLCAFQDRSGNFTREIYYGTHKEIINNIEVDVPTKQPITIGLVSEWIDDADQNEFVSVWEEFSSIMSIPKASEQQIKEYEERIKKKLNLTPNTKSQRKSKTTH